MQIPIQNIYFLLCYAWNKLDEQDIVDVRAIDTTELIDLFAKILINGTTRLMKRGLDRYYIEDIAVVNGVKGKLNLSDSLKRNTLFSQRTVCAYDEFDYNVLHNQIVKMTIQKLLKLSVLDTNLRNELHRLFIKFPPIDNIHIRHAHFQMVRLHKNNYHYDFLLKVCEILHESLLIDEASGTYRFKDFIREEKAMAALFEAFVRNFYKLEQSNFHVGSKKIRWKLIPENDADLNMLPEMITDISLISPSRKIIIDTKFYKEAFRTKMVTSKIISAHLYQLFAYLKNQEDGSAVTESCEGILLYPAVGNTFHYSYRYEKHRMLVRSINLNQNWHMIRDELLQIIS